MYFYDVHTQLDMSTILTDVIKFTVTSDVRFDGYLVKELVFTHDSYAESFADANMHERSVSDEVIFKHVNIDKTHQEGVYRIVRK